MKEFKNYHPIVNFTYFMAVICFTMLFMHPVFLGISFLSAVLYSVILKGAGKILKTLCLLLPFSLCMALMNSLFNHEGMTILAYFPNGNPFTLESVIYGFAAAVMILAVICHFSCYNEIMTSDKFIYLFGKLIPVLSLVISMILKFIPGFIARFKEISSAQASLGRGLKKGSVFVRLRNAVRIFSILLTWSLENSVELADSMKSRGYGLSGRKAYSLFSFTARDGVALLWMLINIAFVLSLTISGILSYSYFPVLKTGISGVWEIAGVTAYFLFCITPVIIEVREEYRWKTLK